MEQEDSNAVELYEEMLYQRAVNGTRPVLYVSSRLDLECSVLLLLEEAPEAKLAGRLPPAAGGIRYRAMMN